MSETILVTGGYGFLGRAAAAKFKSRGNRVVGIGNGRWDAAEYRMHGFDAWFDSPVTLSSLLTLDEQFGVIVHCAGNGSVGYSVEHPLQDFQKTVVSTAEVLEYMRLNNPGAMLIYPSSAGVYGAKNDAPIKESDSLNPISPYGFHKRIVEELCQSYSRSYGLRVAIIRFFSIYGPGLTKQLLWDACTKLTSSQNEAVFWGTGDETRDWINIDDATELILRCADSERQFSILNGASGKRVTVKDVLSMLRKDLDCAAEVRFNNQVREGDPRYYHADISEAVNIGWMPAVTLQDGIRRYIQWFRKHCTTA
ncbi:MAG: NAD-dependent epimerase/dehydratase family protein [Nitrospiraceae bacterium]|nr:NAD-dependent epimerase/dehydratase family protein [Nitrospiraceae bacterium]